MFDSIQKENKSPRKALERWCSESRAESRTERFSALNVRSLSSVLPWPRRLTVRRLGRGDNFRSPYPHSRAAPTPISTSPSSARGSLCGGERRSFQIISLPSWCPVKSSVNAKSRVFVSKMAGKVDVFIRSIVICPCLKLALTVKECKKVDPCRYSTDEGEINLLELAGTGKPRREEITQ